MPVNDNVILEQEAQEYVESIMASQRVTRVSTPVQSGRKRHLSLPSVNDTLTKMAKGEDGTRVKATARRSLYKPTPLPAPRNINSSSAAKSPAESDTQPDLRHLIATLSSDMHMMFTSLTERIDKLESGLEERISTKVAQLLDKRVNTELGRIKKDINARLDTFRETLREQVADDVEELSKKVETLSSSTTQQNKSPDLTYNIVIRNLPETVNENITEKVNTIISESLNIADVKISKAVRKTSDSSSRPGIVIVTFHSATDKSKVMKVKANLRNDRQFGRVYINHDQSRDDRRLASNLRVIVDAVNRGDTNLSVQGTRIVRKQTHNNNNNNNSNTRSDDSHRNTYNRDNRSSSSNDRTSTGNNRPYHNQSSLGNTGRDNRDG